MFGKKKLVEALNNEKNITNKLKCLSALLRWQISRDWCDEKLKNLFFFSYTLEELQCNFELIRHLGGTTEQLFEKIEPILEEYDVERIYINSGGFYYVGNIVKRNLIIHNPIYRKTLIDKIKDKFSWVSRAKLLTFLTVLLILGMGTLGFLFPAIGMIAALLLFFGVLAWVVIFVIYTFFKDVS